ncbi:RNA polymerase sigma factor [Novipirellula artificiosorum]|uniref:ECF RNA polymerase sigma factor SigW n=1 Tax=Novipirellula artificiosorum TaxID=2528016 RepID=A0A5C6DZV3_9BACT|nr:sigma-70 family RNA polymerase sigma factor [Novipirellula artificiosorum]TWU41985.1 ECF RNA polymerase sigma factor SigW [Novipirellula artificiosorum]
MEDSTALLIERYRQNDPTAFTQLVSRYHSLVFGVCMRCLRHRQDAEDVTQETFSRVARYLDRWDTRRPIEPWLATIAGNRCRTYLSRHRSPIVSPLPIEPAGTHAEHQIAEQTLREEIGLALSQQPANHRMAFRLFHDQAMNYAEIAERLDCPIGTAKTWVHRARTGLMQQLVAREVLAGAPKHRSKGDSPGKELSRRNHHHSEGPE